MNKYNVLDTINTNHFYMVSVDYKSGDGGFDELFPTYEDCENYLENLDFSFDAVVYEYNLTDYQMQYVDGDIQIFFDNLDEFHSSCQKIANV